MLDDSFLRKRISVLCRQKGVSEYQMSIDLGHSKNYIQGITSGRTLPSMSEFFYICEYLGTSPKDFFDDEIKNPALVQTALSGILNLGEQDLNNLIYIIERYNNQ